MDYKEKLSSIEPVCSDKTRAHSVTKEEKEKQGLSAAKKRKKKISHFFRTLCGRDTSYYM